MEATAGDAPGVSRSRCTAFVCVGRPSLRSALTDALEGSGAFGGVYTLLATDDIDEFSGRGGSELVFIEPHFDGATADVALERFGIYGSFTVVWVLTEGASAPEVSEIRAVGRVMTLRTTEFLSALPDQRATLRTRLRLWAATLHSDLTVAEPPAAPRTSEPGEPEPPANDEVSGFEVSSDARLVAGERYEHVVIVGSAGSQPQLKELFAGAATAVRRPLVVAIHHNRRFTSDLCQLMSELVGAPSRLLARVTQLRAAEATTYVIPPGRPASSGPGPDLDEVLVALGSIDRLTLTIVLSGMGCDASVGLNRMRRARGRVVVVDPRECDQTGMPQAAIDAGAADAVLGLREVSWVLRRVLARPCQREDDDRRSSAA